MAGFLTNMAAALERKADGTTRMGRIEEIWAGLFGGASKTGVSVTWQTALRVTTVLACCQRIAEGTSTVPLKVYQKAPGDKDARVASELPLNAVLETAPSDHQNSLEFREQLTFHVRLEGNAYAWINRVRGEIVELVPFEPSALVRHDTSDPAEWRYTFRMPDGYTVVLPQSEVWHLRGPSWNTREGMRAIQLTREAIALALLSEETQGALHANGAQPGGLLSFTAGLGEPAKARLKAYAAENLSGIRNAFRTLVLDQDAKFTPFQMKGVDNEHLATRRFQVEEICRGLGILPIMVGHYDKAATFASAEQMFLHHVVHGIRPWHRRFEYSMDHQLLTKEQRAAGFYTRFTDTELLRGDHKARAEYYKFALDAGWMLPSEARAFEDMPYVAGLDRPRMPLNQAIVGDDGMPILPEKNGG